MNCFLLLACMVTGTLGIAVPGTELPDASLTGSQFSSFDARDFLDGGLTDDSMWLPPEDGVDLGLDSQLFLGSDEFSSPMVFDEASANTCYDPQSSLFMDPSGLDARDLTDDFPGLQDLVAPLKPLQGPKCSSTDQQQGSSGGGETPKQEPDSSPSTETETSHDIPPGGCSNFPGHYYALCCTGPIVSFYFMDCTYYSLLQGCPPGQQYCCQDYDLSTDVATYCQRMNWKYPPDPTDPTDDPYHMSPWAGPPGYIGPH